MGEKKQEPGDGFAWDGLGSNSEDDSRISLNHMHAELIIVNNDPSTYGRTEGPLIFREAGGDGECFDVG